MAIQAFLPVLQDLYPWQLAFGIGTPAAAQRAALDDYGGADARTVIDAEFLNIEYQPQERLLIMRCLFSSYRTDISCYMH